MATGDHIQTAISVGIECKIIPDDENNIGVITFNDNNKLEIQYKNRNL